MDAPPEASTSRPYPRGNFHSPRKRRPWLNRGNTNRRSFSPGTRPSDVRVPLLSREERDRLADERRRKRLLADDGCFEPPKRFTASPPVSNLNRSTDERPNNRYRGRWTRPYRRSDERRSTDNTSFEPPRRFVSSPTPSDSNMKDEKSTSSLDQRWIQGPYQRNGTGPEEKRNKLEQKSPVTFNFVSKRMQRSVQSCEDDAANTRQDQFMNRVLSDLIPPVELEPLSIPSNDVPVPLDVSNKAKSKDCTNGPSQMPQDEAPMEATPRFKPTFQEIQPPAPVFSDVALTEVNDPRIDLETAKSKTLLDAAIQQSKQSPSITTMEGTSSSLQPVHSSFLNSVSIPLAPSNLVPIFIDRLAVHSEQRAIRKNTIEEDYYISRVCFSNIPCEIFGGSGVDIDEELAESKAFEMLLNQLAQFEVVPLKYVKQIRDCQELVAPLSEAVAQLIREIIEWMSLDEKQLMSWIETTRDIIRQYSLKHWREHPIHLPPQFQLPKSDSDSIKPFDTVQPVLEAPGFPQNQPILADTPPLSDNEAHLQAVPLATPEPNKVELLVIERHKIDGQIELLRATIEQQQIQLGHLLSRKLAILQETKLAVSETLPPQ